MTSPKIARLTLAFFVVFLLAPLLPGVGISASQTARGDSLLEARTSALAAELRCPVCQGVSIQDSPSELAQQMRSVVRDQLREGKSEDEVRAYFVASYGEWILLAPKARGLNLLLYILPGLLVVVGLYVITRAVRRWTNNSAPV